MSANDVTCAIHDEATCWTVPAEFVRLKYFFGQRLGVLDLTDEQGYLIGKQRFHNLRAHGSGVLCGLTAERYVFPAGSPPETDTTILLIRRGAALDGCGREVIVGWDQCIDVAAWFRQNKVAKGIEDWPTTPPAGGARLFVCLKYRECPSDPAPAPRDPCGCETTGCEFGRVREGFQLSLITQDEANAECLKRILQSGMGGTPPIETFGFGDAVNSVINGVVGGPCNDPAADPCLCLASFLLEFNASGEVQDISAPDNTIPERLSLLSTATLQQSLVASLVAAGNDAFIGPGPRVTEVLFVGTSATVGTLSFPVKLLQDAAGVDVPLAPSSGTPETPVLRLYGFDANGAWIDRSGFLTPAAPTPAWNAATSRYEFTFDLGATPLDPRYRLEFVLGESHPVVDVRMRPLTPLKFARHFRLVIDATTTFLTRADTLFAP